MRYKALPKAMRHNVSCSYMSRNHILAVNSLLFRQCDHKAVTNLLQISSSPAFQLRLCSTMSYLTHQSLTTINNLDTLCYPSSTGLISTPSLLTTISSCLRLNSDFSNPYIASGCPLRRYQIPFIHIYHFKDVVLTISNHNHLYSFTPG